MSVRFKTFLQMAVELGAVPASCILNIRVPCAKFEPAYSCRLVFCGRHEWVDATEAGSRQDEIWRSRTMTAMTCQTHKSERFIIDFCMISAWCRSYALRYLGAGLRWCRSTCFKDAPQDPLLHGTCAHAMLSLPGVSLFSGNIFRYCTKDFFLLSSEGFCHWEKSKKHALYFLRDGDYYCIYTAVRSWSLEVLFKQRPAFHHYQQTPHFPELIGWYPISG